MGYIGTGSIDLADLSDAIISGTMPTSTEEGQLWIDTSSELPVLKVYKNGKWIDQYLDVSKMDKGLAATVTETFETLGSITNDNLLTVNDRLVILQELNRLIGKMVSTKDKDNYPNGLPAIEELDDIGLGSIAITRESSLLLGIESTDSVFIGVEIAYESLKNYFNSLNTDEVNIWDITDKNKLVNIEIDGDTFRERWLTFYNALLLLNAEILAVPGPAGQAAITMELSNDNITIATDNNGHGAHYSHTQTHIAIYEGTANITHEWSIKASVSTYKDSDGVTKPEVIGKLNENGTLYTVEEVTVYTDDAYVDFTATREGYATFTKRMIISKVKTGESAINEWLSFSSSILKKDTNGIFNPQDITFEYKRRIGGGDIENQEGIIKIFEYQISSTGEVLVYDSSKDGSNGFDNKVTWKPSSPNIEYIRVELYDKQSRLLDIETVNVISDGQDAVLPVTISLDNDTIVIPSNSDGNLYPDSFNYADVTISAYMGNGYINLVTDSSPYNLTFIPSGEITGGRYVKDGSNRWSYKVTGLSGDSGTIDIFLSEKGSGIQLAHKTVTIFKNHDGASGVYQWVSIPKVISISLDPNNNLVFSPTNFTVNSYRIIGNQDRELDPSINEIQLDGVQISSGTRSTLMTVGNGSIVQTKELMEAIGTGIEYRDFEIQVSISRGSVIETEFIEIVADGRHGSTGHVWIQYADDELGLNMTDDPTDKEYMGVAVSYDGVRPKESSDYTWQKTVGNTGLPGENGSMLHVKYSNDGGKNFTGNDGEDVGIYIGMYVDFIIEDSTDPSKYTWNKREPDENIVGYLSNESITFPADEHGKVLSYTGNTGTFHIYKGIKEITTSDNVEFSIIYNPDSIVTSTIDRNGIYTINNMDNSKDKRSDSIILRATIGEVIIEKTININKSLTGESGRTVSLTTPDLAFVYDAKTSTRGSQTITWTATAYNTNSTVYYEFIVNGSSQQNSTSSKYNQAVPINFTNMPVTVEVKIREGSDSGAVVATDHQTIFGVKAGYTPIKDTDYFDGKDKYVWIMFADDEHGNGITSNPEGKRYQGVAYNKDTPISSNTKSDYKWLALYDNVIVGGRNLFPHSGNFRGRPLSFWWDNGGGLIYNDTERYNGFGTLETNVGAGIHGQWMTLENNVEYMYSVTLKSEDTFSGSFSVPLHYHAGKDNVNRNKIQVLDGDISYTENDLGQFKRLWIRFKLTGDANSFRPFIYWGSGTPRKFFIANLQLERGNILTDWTLAPEDWEYQLEIISKDTLENTKQQAELEKTRADKIYNHLINVKDKDGKNTVTGTVRTNLITAKNTLNTRYNILLVRINETLAKDGPVSQTDKDRINTSYNSFMIAIADFDLRAQEAGSDRMNIVDKRVTDVENYSTADSIIQRVTTTETYLDGKENPLNNLAEWKTAAEIKMKDDNIVLAVRQSKEYKNDLDPKTIVSSINMTKDKIAIDASKIELNGKITMNAFAKGLGIADKTETLSDNEIFTDTADDSVVHVEVDGKSYQYVKNDSKNLAPHPEYWSGSGVSHDGHRLIIQPNSIATATITWGGQSGMAYYAFDTVSGVGNKYLIESYYYDINGSSTREGSNLHTANGYAGEVPSGRFTRGNYTSWNSNIHTVRVNIINNQTTGSNLVIENISIRNGSTVYEPPTPTPDYPIEIHSLNDFDVVSSVGKRNLIPNSDFSKSVTGPLFTVNGKTYNQYPESWNVYNGGISNPTTSYHAYLDSETFGFNTLVFNESNGVRNWKAINKNTNSIMNANDTEYVFSANVNTTKLGSKLFGGFHYFKKGGTVQAFHSGSFSVSPTAENQWQTISGKVPFPIDIDLTKSVNFFVYGYNFSSNSILYVRNIKLEVGNSPTPYSLSPEDTTESDNHVLIDKINLLLSEPLRSVGDVKDRLFRDSDGLWKVERNVGEYAFDGTEDWGIMTNVGTENEEYIGFHYLQSFMNLSASHSSMSSHFKYESGDIAPNNIFSQNYALFGTDIFDSEVKIVLEKSLLPSNDVAGFQQWIKNEYSKGKPFTIVYKSTTPTIETLSQDFQDKLNNLRSFQDSNYVYTIINNKTDIISEKLKPTLHATFKGGGWYNRWKTENELNGKAGTDIVDELQNSLNDWDTTVAKKGDLVGITDTLNGVAGDVEAEREISERISKKVQEALNAITGIEQNLLDRSVQWNFLNSYMTFSDSGMLIKSKDGSTGILINEKEIAFLDSKNKSVADITSDRMRINKGIFVDSVRVGQHEEKDLGNGHTITVWVGDVE